jgi:hypothetical protein
MNMDCNNLLFLWLFFLSIYASGISFLAEYPSNQSEA